STSVIRGSSLGDAIQIANGMPPSSTISSTPSLRPRLDGTGRCSPWGKLPAASTLGARAGKRPPPPLDGASLLCQLRQSFHPFAPVAPWIEQRFPKPLVGRSSRLGGARHSTYLRRPGHRGVDGWWIDR